MTGESRLQVTVENITSDGAVLEGRLELCVNNAWGTICDTLFGPQDAAVACSQLSGFTQEGNDGSPHHVHVQVTMFNYRS